MVDKTAVSTEIADLEEQLRKKKRLLEKLENANTQLRSEPAPGTVLKFERAIAGSVRKYTFVLLSVGKDSWTATGKKNALNVIGLKESGNTWQDVTVAVGQNLLYRVTEWAEAGDPFWHYYQGMESSRLYRSLADETTIGARENKVERYEPVLQTWVEASVYRPNLKYITAEQARLVGGPKAVAR